MIGGANDDIMVAAGMGNIAFGDSLGMSLNGFGSDDSKNAGKDAKTDELSDQSWKDAGNVDTTEKVTGNDVIVTLGKFNAAVGDAGQDIVVAGGKLNFVYGDSLTQGWTLDSIQLPSFDDLLPDIDFSALSGIALDKLGALKDFKLPNVDLKIDNLLISSVTISTSIFQNLTSPSAI